MQGNRFFRDCDEVAVGRIKHARRLAPRVLNGDGSPLPKKRTVRWVYSGSDWFAVGGSNYGYSTQDAARRSQPAARHEFESVR